MLNLNGRIEIKPIISNFYRFVTSMTPLSVPRPTSLSKSTSYCANSLYFSKWNILFLIQKSCECKYISHDLLGEADMTFVSIKYHILDHLGNEAQVA